MFCLHAEVACDYKVTAKLRVADFLVIDIVKHLLLIVGIDEKLNSTLCFRSLRNGAKWIDFLGIMIDISFKKTILMFDNFMIFNVTLSKVLFC